MMERPADNSLVIENRALIHLSNIMIANARAHKFKEMATLAKSKRSNERLSTAIDTLIALVGSKTLNKIHVSTLEAADKALEEAIESTDTAPVKTKAFKAIIKDIEKIIRAHRWYDMPQPGDADMNLITEFYGDKQKEAEIESKEGAAE